jgi:surface protein
MGKTKTRIKNKSTRKKNSKKRVNISKKRLTRRTKSKTKSRSRSKSNKQMRAHVFTNKEELQEALNQYYDYPTKMIKKYGKINKWDVSQITDMSYLFMETNFNEDISNWNVSNVTDMSYMFYSATKFNQPIGSWDVSKVTNMAKMLSNATDFNQPIGSWNVSNVTNMEAMFYDASSFNQPIGSWNVWNVTNMAEMFYNAKNFNQPIGHVDVDNLGWNVWNVTNMTHMFQNATNFNQPIGSWNVSTVTDMRGMFYNATNFNQPIGKWNVSNVTNMAEMFYNATNFNQPIGEWNVSNVKDMTEMFSNATNFNQPIGEWNVSNVKDMIYMFYNATNFEQQINWDITKKNSTSMFHGTRVESMNAIKTSIVNSYINKNIKFNNNALKIYIKKYIDQKGKFSNILKYALELKIDDKKFHRKLIKNLLEISQLTNEEKNSKINGWLLVELYIMFFGIEKPNDVIYDELKPEGYEDHSPESYEEDNGTVTKKTHKNRFKPDYKIIIDMHGELSSTRTSDMSTFPFRTLKFLVKEGCILNTFFNISTIQKICEGRLNTYSHKFAENKKMKTMHLSIDSNKERDSELGIFICNPSDQTITKLLSVENKRFVFEKNSGFRATPEETDDLFGPIDRLPKGFYMYGTTLDTTLSDVINFIVSTLKKHSSKILGKENINFKNCDLIVSACRGIENNDDDEHQHIYFTPRARSYLNENDLMLEDVNEDTLPDDFFEN